MIRKMLFLNKVISYNTSTLYLF